MNGEDVTLNIAIIGAAGFVGTNLALAAEQRGHRLTLVDVNDRLGRLGASGLLERSSCHFLDLSQSDARIPDCDVMISLAALPQVDFSLHYPERTFTNNIGIMSAVLEAARLRRIPLLFASSIEVYGGNDGDLLTESSELWPLSPYAASKIACESITESYQHVYGNRFDDGAAHQPLRAVAGPGPYHPPHHRPGSARHRVGGRHRPPARLPRCPGRGRCAARPCRERALG